jgi:hypothetical protein
MAFEKVKSRERSTAEMDCRKSGGLDVKWGIWIIKISVMNIA